MFRKALTVPVFFALAATASPARADFAGCIASLKASAAGEGISAAVFDRAMAGVTPDPKVIEALNSQPEFKTPIWEYLGFAVDDQKVADGRAMMARHAGALASAESRYGVDRYAIAAVWGVESDYGRMLGKWPLPQALGTLTCTANRRQAYFRGELIATLKIVQRGDLSPEKLRGSWAGAFGQTQFMPSTYLRLAVDGDGDGRRDLVDSAADALHSTANFLAKSGWQTGASWGYEVRVPASFAGATGRSPKQPVSSWAARGITRIDGSALTGGGNAGLLMPAGRNGPGFLVFKNYDAAYSYNGADSYALAISLLSDRLRGRPGIQGQWPTDDRGISRIERKEIQELLLRRGYQIGEADGAIGQLTRQAIADFQPPSGLDSRRARGRQGSGCAEIGTLKPVLTPGSPQIDSLLKSGVAYDASMKSIVGHGCDSASRTAQRMTRAFTMAALVLTPAGLALPQGQALAQEKPVVIELYTSQGCSSCPPADKLLSEVARKPNVIAWTLPVDYWDYNGWKDTYAKPVHTARQKAYSKLRGDGQVYTPQAVIDGIAHVVGSDAGAIREASETCFGKSGAMTVALSVAEKNGVLEVDVGAAPDGVKGDANLVLIRVTRSTTVTIGRGENSGKTVTYTNIGRTAARVGVWDGAPRKFSIPADTAPSAEADGWIVVLQGGSPAEPGVIFAAAKAPGL